MPTKRSPDDAEENAEWRDALLSLVAADGPARACELMDMLARLAMGPNIGWVPLRNTPYVNSIPADKQPSFPGDLALEERLAAIMRWNALAMVVRANQAYGELGGQREALKAAELLANEWGISAEVWSATSFSELARDAREVERENRLQPLQPERTSHLARCLPGPAPIIAATDYVRAWPQLIASYLHAPYCVLGTDGFGRSDTRAALRGFFEIDHRHIALAALTQLRGQAGIDTDTCQNALQRFGLSAEAIAPWNV